MKKSWFVFMFLAVSFLPLIEAGSIGISPTHFDFFFEPGLERTFSFNVVDAGSENSIESYLAGDLTEYANLSETEFIGSGSFQVTLKLPESIEKPGRHRLLVGVRQKSPEGEDGAVKGLAAVQAAIDVYVPYPGTYAEAKFDIQDINEGENAPYELTINNLGTEDIVAKTFLNISENSKEVYSVQLENLSLKSKEKITLEGVINSSAFPAGIYQAGVLIEYGETLQLEDLWRVGVNFVNITAYDYLFETGKINKVDVEVENLWNSKMENVYFKATITEQGKILDQFQSASLDLESWEKKNLTGFFDATEIPEGKYLMSLNLIYSNESDSKLVYIRVYSTPKDYTLIWIIGGVSVVALILLIGLMVLMIRLHRLLKSRRLKSKDDKEKK